MRTTQRLDRGWRLAALGLASVVTVYLIATTGIISRDGTRWVRMARDLADHPLKVMREHDQPPLFPWTIVAVYDLGGRWLHADDLQAWAISAQLASGVFAVLAILPLFALARQVGPPCVAGLAAMIAAVFPVWQRNGADALSDTLHLLLFLTGVFKALIGPDWQDHLALIGWAIIATVLVVSALAT